ncbi:hypothetical protein AB0B62_29490 [Micromonospora chalcea]|uniref:hypothetical protein n=1 Tax=Micromonospora chalcea TaxID=1874 RepID=UPI002379BD13|nr:hypothetical protein [Micromonospora chalcea]WDQ00882.1 hypothetical protein PVK74_03575 [Micromonospora chalcea]
MIAIVAYYLALIEPEQILSCLPSITVVLKFLTALAGFTAAAMALALRTYRWTRLAVRRRRGTPPNRHS